MRTALFKAEKFSSLIETNGIRYGTGSPPPILEPSKETLPFVRATDIKEGEIKTQNLLHISKEQPAKLDKCKLSAGEIIIVRSGVNTGDCAVVPSELAGAYAAYDLIIRLDNKKILPKFATKFLDTKLGRIQINLLKARAAQPHINADEFGSIEIPLPPLPIQEKLVEEMERARESRRRKLSEADASLSTLDGWLLDTLGITPPPEDNRKVFGIKFNQLNGRIDTQFYLPTFQKIQEAISKVNYSELGELVSYSSEMWDKSNADENDTFRYIEISGVNRNTGEATAEDVLVSEAPSRARKLVCKGDILVSLTRPHHGSIAQIDLSLDKCVASTGFSVLRYFDKAKINPSYLWAILRTKISLLQMQQRSSGGNYPAITEDELNKILIPTPDLPIQEMIAEEVRQRKENARRLKSEAESEWQAAKDWFEAQLLAGDEK